ncbi:MAG: hypothetical protein CMD01_03850 [Flavobacteriales bacterium]|nr:hypothetical protein [Flavobacteriales bacterium]MBG16692.1 hypothetical protein [Crocinitomicaceae bacterium]|tara:strand:+ start:35 stop:349 length:315 start_codon:yes stop_codon:yes gene_type:complete
MILYNVTINIDYDCHDDWLKWMKQTHVPDVLDTGLFINAKICRIHAEEQGGVSYSIQYLLNSKSDYNTYQDLYAPKLQQEHTQKFSGKFVAFRTLLEVVYEKQP